MTEVAHSLADQAPLRAARIPLGKIRVHPRNLRLDLGDLTELAASLDRDGQLQPALVHRKGEFFELLDGHRRYGASVIAHRRTLDCLVVPTRSDAEAIQGMLATALHARQLSAEERARGVQAMLTEFGLHPRVVAERLGVSVATVHRWRHAPDDTTEPTPPRPAHPGPRPRRAPTTVSARRIAELADAWTERVSNGLTAEQAGALIDEIRSLLPSAGSTQEVHRG